MAFRQFTAGTTVLQAVAGNQKRTGLVIFNNGAATVFLKGDASDTLAGGLPVASGGAFSMIRRDGDDTGAALYAVTSLGTADLRIQESFESVTV